jgi:hypothetical protein
LTFLFLNLAEVPITISILLIASSKLSDFLLCLIISLPPTDVARILSFGKVEFRVYQNQFVKIKVFYSSGAGSNIF